MNRKRPEHLAFIRGLPCCICGAPRSEAAHVRMNDAATGKMQALGQKPHDDWSVPLCAGHHRELPGAQHRIGEANFWRRHGIDPLDLAMRLAGSSGNQEAGEFIVRQARRLSPWR